MKIIKPFRLSITSRVVEVAGRSPLLCIAGTIFVPMGVRGLLAEQAMWRFLPTILGEDLFDEGYAKLRGEVLVWGSCYPPGGAARSSSVRVCLGSVDKRLVVVGERKFRDGVPTDPLPFQKMPIDHAHAFGGEGSEANPRGMGYRPIDEAGQRIHPLPNVELPGRLIRTPSDRPEPALLRPIPFHWQPRSKKVGTYDARWARESFPALASDMDPTWFQAAPSDQWHSGYFRGDEPFAVENMHPDRAKLEGTLPGLVVRFFLRKRDQPVLEVSSRLETVHIFPDAERLILVFRAGVPVLEDDANEVLTLLGAVETLGGASRSREHYISLLEARERREAPVGPAAIEEPDLLPVEPLVDVATIDAPEPMAELVAIEFHAMQNANRGLAQKVRAAEEDTRKGFEAARADVRASPKMPPADAAAALEIIDQKEQSSLAMLAKMKGIDLNQSVSDPKAFREKMEQSFGDAKKNEPAPPPAMGDIRAYVDGKIAEGKADAKARLAALRESVQKQGAGTGGRADLEQKLLEVEQAIDKSQPCHPGIPAPPSALMAQYMDQASARLASSSEDGLRHAPEGSPLRARMAQADEKVKEAGSVAAHKLRELDEMAQDSHRRTVHHFERHQLRPEPFSADARARLERHHRDGTEGVGLDLLGADFSGTCLPGIKLPGSYLDGSLLDRVDWNSASLGRATLARCSLVEANLTAADLSQANLGFADLSGANLSLANLDGTILEGACLDNANLSRTKCRLQMVARAFADVDFSGADLSMSLFSQCTLVRCRFVGATLNKTLFSECTLTECSFDDADVSAVTLSQTRVDRCTFERAKMKQFVAVLDTHVSASTFRGASLDAASLRGVPFLDCDFEGATMVGTDVSGANLSGANLARIDGRKLLAIRTDFSDAKLSGSNLMDALMQKARLYAADLSRANLFQADLSRVRADTKLCLENANLGRVRLLPKAPSDA